jgi:hypothetical protein
MAQLSGCASMVLSEGWPTQADIELDFEIDAWAQSSDAFYADTYCEAVGFC